MRAGFCCQVLSAIFCVPTVATAGPGQIPLGHACMHVGAGAQPCVHVSAHHACRSTSALASAPSAGFSEQGLETFPETFTVSPRAGTAVPQAQGHACMAQARPSARQTERQRTTQHK